MQENSILNFIGEYLNPGLREIFSGGTVENISLDEETLKLSITARLDMYVEDRFVISAQNEIKNALGINKAVIIPHYHQSAFTQACVPQLARAMKDNVAAANGFLENAQFTVKEGVVEIYVFNGAEILIESGAKEFLSRYIKDTFGVQVTVEIKGEGSAKLDSPEYVQMQAEGIKIEVPVEEDTSKPKAAKQEFEDLPISLTNSKVIYGSKIKSKPVPLKEISIEDGNVTVWGKVFSLDMRDTKDGGEGHTML